MQIFVYGTLKRGHCRHQHLDGQRFLGVARTEPLYRMVNVGEYPGLLDIADGLPIDGEVWDVDGTCAATLDIVESIATGEYERRSIQLQPPFDAERVEAYFYLRPTAGLPDCGTCWTGE